MHARIKNPALIIPESMKPLVELGRIVHTAAVPQATVELVLLRVSQINGCSVCVDGHFRSAGRAGVSNEKSSTVAAWRTVPYFTAAERAALALAEAATRIADSEDPVPDKIWDEAARHFSEQELAALILAIGLTHLYNCVNVATRQVAGPQSWE